MGQFNNAYIIPYFTWFSIIIDAFLKSDWVVNWSFLEVIFLEDCYVEFGFSISWLLFIYANYGEMVLLYLVRRVLQIKEL